MTYAYEAAKALVGDDGEVLGRLVGIVDDDVAVPEGVASVAVQELGLHGPRRAQELRVCKARSQRELTIGEGHRAAASAAGATWVGNESARPPVPLDRVITFAPAGSVVVHALSCLRKGGIVAINAIHLDQMPAFDYDSLLWGERQIRSVANMTRQDARDFLRIAAELNIQPQANVFSLENANQALIAVRDETENGPAVIVP